VSRSQRVVRVAGSGSKPDGVIDWDEHVEAHTAFIQRNLHQPNFKLLSAERIGELGGFGYAALVRLLGRKPTTWRKLDDT
jgi:hypothetical protein